MNQQMTEYMNDLTGNDLETLEKIISVQYRKFIRFYRLVESYSDSIKNMNYEFNSSSSLDVNLTFNTKKDLNSIKKDIESSMKSSDYEGTVEVKGKTLYMSIILDEE